MKIEKLKYRKLSIGETVKVHDFEYIENLYKEKNSSKDEISCLDENVYGKEYIVENIKDVDAESVCKYFKKSKYKYYLKNSNYGNYFFEFEIESCE